MLNKKIVAFATAALTLASVSTGFAADKMMGAKMSSGKMTHGKMAHGKMAKMVAYCATCKGYMSASDAKKMHMMDPMGHKMTMMPMSKVPKGSMMMSGKSTMMAHPKM